MLQTIEQHYEVNHEHSYTIIPRTSSNSSYSASYNDSQNRARPSLDVHNPGFHNKSYIIWSEFAPVQTCYCLIYNVFID